MKCQGDVALTVAIRSVRFGGTGLVSMRVPAALSGSFRIQARQVLGLGTVFPGPA